MSTVAPPMIAVRPAAVRVHRRGAWIAIGLVLAVVLVLGVAGSFVGSIAYQAIPATSRVFSASIDAAHLDVDGTVTIERGAAHGAVVESSGARGLSAPSNVERVTAGTLDVRSSCPLRVFENHCARSYVLRVPQGVSVIVDTDSGDVTTRGMNGPLTLHSGQGDVIVDGSAGPVRLSSGQGDVTATGLKGATAVAVSGQGEVRLQFTSAPRDVSATSGQGDVTVELPRSPAAYQVHASSGQGDVTDDVAENPASRQVVRATSGQGDVTVNYGKR